MLRSSAILIPPVVNLQFNRSNSGKRSPPNFEGLVDRYYVPLYRFALSLSRCEAAASDLTQQTYYLWATKGHQLRDPSRAKSWLFTTLYHEYLHGRRRSDSHPQVTLEVAEAELPDVEPEVVRHASVTEVLRAIEDLSDYYRAPLILFHIEGLTYKEIAEILEAPIGTVMSQISRGRRKVIQALKMHAHRTASAPTGRIARQVNS